MPRSAQHKLSSIIHNVTKTILSVSETASRDDSVEVGKLVLESFFDILGVSRLFEALRIGPSIIFLVFVLQGTQSQLNNPLPGDIATEFMELEFDTDIEAAGEFIFNLSRCFLPMSKFTCLSVFK